MNPARSAAIAYGTYRRPAVPDESWLNSDESEIRAAAALALGVRTDLLGKLVASTGYQPPRARLSRRTRRQYSRPRPEAEGHG
ncbi:hypothetical protein [Nocardia sp. NPDC050710]|uniref:hypothetical protein n=1 Tax=Nocardia sp. NPDC050710 TaxID=3157220 RepID=UPI0033FE00E1